LKFYDNKVWANGYKTLKYEFRIHTKNPSNWNSVYIRYSVLILSIFKVPVQNCYLVVL
jgi:hypothetical protein